LSPFISSLIIFTGSRKHTTIVTARPPDFALWNPQLFSASPLGVLAVISSAALQNHGAGRRRQRGFGNDGRRLVNPNTTDPDERKLLNVVEEMAIASGVPVPQVYVMDDEDGINAFAAGHKPGDADRHRHARLHEIACRATNCRASSATSSATS
jgi:Zn-dependent protease with chaperone function